LNVLIRRSGAISLPSLPLIVGIFLSLLSVIISFVPATIARWTLVFKFVFFSVYDAMVRVSMDFFYDSRMSPDLPRGTGKSISGDLDVDDEGSE
jgi:hypothetical protein